MIGVWLGIFVPIFYIVITGAVFEKMKTNSVGCDMGCKGTRHDSTCNKNLVRGLSILWPLLLPLWIGTMLGRNRPSRSSVRLSPAELRQLEIEAGITDGD